MKKVGGDHRTARARVKVGDTKSVKVSPIQKEYGKTRFSSSLQNGKTDFCSSSIKEDRWRPPYGARARQSGRYKVGQSVSNPKVIGNMEKPDFHPHFKMVRQIFVAQVLRKIGGDRRTARARVKVGDTKSVKVSPIQK